MKTLLRIFLATIALVGFAPEAIAGTGPSGPISPLMRVQSSGTSYSRRKIKIVSGAVIDNSSNDSVDVVAVGIGIYGDGSDGSCAFDGNATPAGATKNSSTSYTLARDVFCTIIAVSAGVTVQTANFRVLASQSITVAATGAIANDGNAASGSTAGGASSSNTIGGSQAGANGNTGSASGGNAASISLGGYGGAGGHGGSTNTGGAQANVTAPTAAQGMPHDLLLLARMASFNVKYTGGSGGSGGAGDGVNAGGGGGGGAGTLLLMAPTITNNGTIDCSP